MTASKVTRHCSLHVRRACRAASVLTTHAARIQVGGIFFSIQRIVQQVCASGVAAAGCATACLRASSAPERSTACMRTGLTR